MRFRNGNVKSETENGLIPLYIPIDAIDRLDFHGHRRKDEETKKTSKGTQLDDYLNQPADWMTKTEIINRFAMQDLPTLTLHRLVKVQAVMKGYYVRQFIFPRKKENHVIACILASKIIRRFVEVRSSGEANDGSDG